MKAKKYWKYSMTLIVLGIIFLFGATFPIGILMILVGISLYYYFQKNLKINVKYEIEEGQNVYKDFKEVWLRINNCKNIWEIITEKHNNNTKVNAGAERSVDRKLTKFKESKLPYLDIKDEKILKLKLRKKVVLFLIDKILIIEKEKIASVDYKDLEIKLSEQKFVETNNVPRDATIIDYTWKYVNKNGQPDKRYSNNKQLPICLYGKVNILDKKNTFNIELQISSHEIYKEIANQTKEIINKCYSINKTSE